MQLVKKTINNDLTKTFKELKKKEKKKIFDSFILGLKSINMISMTDVLMNAGLCQTFHQNIYNHLHEYSLQSKWKMIMSSKVVRECTKVVLYTQQLLEGMKIS